MRALQRSIRPGEWLMLDRGRKIAILREVKTKPRDIMMIRSVTWAEQSEDRALIGYFPDLATAAHVTWGEWVRANPRPPVTEPPRRG